MIRPTTPPPGPVGQIRLEDWRDHQPAEPYDAVISIGAFEHFARPDLATSERPDVYGAFFERCASWLRPDGRLSLQTIAYEGAAPTEGPVARFFNEEVFPESSLPSLSDIVVAAGPLSACSGCAVMPAAVFAHLETVAASPGGGAGPAIQLVGRATYRHYLRYLPLLGGELRPTRLHPVPTRASTPTAKPDRR